MSVAGALILMLNGVQIFMPSPALLLDGKAWVPLRAVAERLGYTIDARPGAHLFAVRPGKQVEVAPSRRVGGATYVPVRFFEKLGAAVAYDKATRVINMQAVFPEEARPAAGGKPPKALKSGPLLSFIVTDPAPWANRQVVLRGEFLGWRANTLWPALRFGPPVSRSDWVLRAEGGAIYCTGKLPGRAIEDRGLRLEVSATVRLTKKGWPYLEVASASPIKGMDGLCCYVVTDHSSYALTQSPRVHLFVRNDGDAPVVMSFPTSQLYDFILRDAEGKAIWRWSRDMVFAQVLTDRTFAPHEERDFAETIPLAALEGITPGVYYVSAELPKVARSFQEPIEVEAPK
jgi:hypothetical protein